MQEIIAKEDFITKKPNRECVINLYPDCTKVSKTDPRYISLNKHLIDSFPVYAFPLGFHAKFEAERPPHQILPMMFEAGKDVTYMQCLVFYENLET